MQFRPKMLAGIDMAMVPQRLFSNYTENLKTWFLNKKIWPLTNKRVNNGSIKSIYSITLPFDLEDCARILYTVIDFAGKGLHVRINAT